MPTIIDRKGWNAREPRPGIPTVGWDQRVGVMIHYSAASATQTPRSIQDFHMDTRKWADIGYNWLVNSVTGVIYRGRGWLKVGAHCEGHNTAYESICGIGKDAAGRRDVSDAALESVRHLIAEAQYRKRAATGGRLVVIGHRDKAATECPGDELYDWMKRGIPEPAPTPAPDGWTEAAVKNLDTIRQGMRGGDVGKSQALLAAAGYPPANSFRSSGVPDGIAGDGWGAAVERFQRARKIKVDRIFGPQTWREALK